MCYNMLTGMLPFSVDEVLQTYSTGEVHVPYPDEWWGAISREAMQFTKQLLCNDPKARITASGALCSPWLSQDPNHVWKDLLVHTTTDLSGPNEDAGKIVVRSRATGSREQELMAAAIFRTTRKRWRAAAISVVALIRLGWVQSKTEESPVQLLGRSSFASIGSCAESDWDYSEADFDGFSDVNSLDSCAPEFKTNRRVSEIDDVSSETWEEAAHKWQESVVTSAIDRNSSIRQGRGAPSQSPFARVSMTGGGNARGFQRNRDSQAVLQFDEDDRAEDKELPNSSPSAVNEHAQMSLVLSPRRSIISKLSKVPNVKGFLSKHKKK